jgi:hypothetical protein
MSDNITLRRAVALQIRDVLLVWSRFALPADKAALSALDAALVEPEPTVKDSLTVDATREPVAHVENGVLVRSALPKGYTGPLYAAPPEPDATREPATYEQVKAAHAADCYTEGIYRWHDYRVGWLAAERFNDIGGRERQPTATGMLGAEADKVLTDEIGWQPCRYPVCVDDSGRCARLFAGECAGPNGEKRGAALKVKEDKP